MSGFGLVINDLPIGYRYLSRFFEGYSEVGMAFASCRIGKSLKARWPHLAVVDSLLRVAFIGQVLDATTVNYRALKVSSAYSSSLDARLQAADSNMPIQRIALAVLGLELVKHCVNWNWLHKGCAFFEQKGLVIMAVATVPLNASIGCCLWSEAAPDAAAVSVGRVLSSSIRCFNFLWGEKPNENAAISRLNGYLFLRDGLFHLIADASRLLLTVYTSLDRTSAPLASGSNRKKWAVSIERVIFVGLSIFALKKNESRVFALAAAVSCWAVLGLNERIYQGLMNTCFHALQAVELVVEPNPSRYSQTEFVYRTAKIVESASRVWEELRAYLAESLSKDSAPKNFSQATEESLFSQRLLLAEQSLKEIIVGQDEAVNTVMAQLSVSALGVGTNQHKPKGVFLFIGPTGVGKTELAKQLAKALYGDSEAFILIPMNGFGEANSVTRLIGSPPGYKNHGEGGQLTEKIRSQPARVFIFDEVEKAHPDVRKLLLTPFDEGTIEDSKGNTIICRQSIFVMTSNLFASTIEEQFRESGSSQQVVDHISEALAQVLSPEFCGRCLVVPFKPMGAEMIDMLIVKILSEAVERFQHQHKLTVEFTPSVEKFLHSKYRPKLGVRALQALVDQKILAVLSKHILLRKQAGEAIEGTAIKVDVGGFGAIELSPHEAL